jgi:hypothetical protein
MRTFESSSLKNEVENETVRIEQENDEKEDMRILTRVNLNDLTAAHELSL